MLKILKQEIPESSKTANVLSKNDKITTNSSESEPSFDDEINKLEEAFDKLQRITTKRVNPTSFIKIWYPRPTPPDIQFEERNFNNQFSVSANKLYKLMNFNI